jgi:UDP-glucuronate 4-epimerase
MVRDFVWGDDVAHVVVLAVEDGSSFGTTPVGGGPQEAVSADPWRVLNVATGRQVGLMTMVGLVETAVGRKAEVIMTDALVAEVRENRMDVSLLGRTLGFTPSVQVEEGVPQAVDWYLSYLAKQAS